MYSTLCAIPSVLPVLSTRGEGSKNRGLAGSLKKANRGL